MTRRGLCRPRPWTGFQLSMAGFECRPRLDRVSHQMRRRRLLHLARVVRLLGHAVPERRAEAVRPPQESAKSRISKGLEPPASPCSPFSTPQCIPDRPARREPAADQDRTSLCSSSSASRSETRATGSVPRATSPITGILNESHSANATYHDARPRRCGLAWNQTVGYGTVSP